MGKKLLSATVLDVQKRRAPSKHYVYVIEVKWADGSELTIYRRYSAFFDFHVGLLDRFPKEAGESDESQRIIPFLPGKKLFGRSHTYKVALSRVKLLDEYVKNLVKLPPKLAECSDVIEFFDADKFDIKPPSAEERERKPAGLIDKILGNEKEDIGPQKQAVVGEVLVLDQYRAVANYKKQNKGELSFATGDLFEVVEKNDNGWWFVSSEDEKQGWVPATFMEPVDDPDEEEHSEKVPEGDNRYISMQKYEAVRDDEVGYEKGVVVKVLEKNLDGWWKVSYDGKQGWTPGSYLEKLNAGYEKDVRPEEEDKGDGEKVPPPRPKQPEVKLRKPPMRRESIERPMSIHGIKGKFNFAELAAKKLDKANKSDGKKATPPAKPEPPKSTAKPKEAPKKPEPPKANNKPKTVTAPKKPDPPKAESKAKAAPKKPEPPKANKKPAASGNLYKTVSSYTKEDDSGITFPEGVTVNVLEKSDTGWWYLEYKGKEGWGPADFLEPASDGKAKPDRPNLPSAGAKPKPATPSAAAKPKPKPTPTPSAAAKPKPKPSTPSAASKPSVQEVGRKGSVAGLAAILNGSPPKPSAVAKPSIVKSTPKPSAAKPSAIKPPTPSAAKKPNGVSAPKGLGNIIGALNSQGSKPLLPTTGSKPALKPVASAKPATPKASPKPAAKDSGNKYKVITSHTKEGDEEVSLTLGDTVTVEEKTEGGWWFVVTSKGSGWAPSDFLEPLGSKPAAAAKPKPAAAAKPKPATPSAAAKPKPAIPAAAAKPKPAIPAAAAKPKPAIPAAAAKPKPAAGAKPKPVLPSAAAKPKPVPKPATPSAAAKPKPTVPAAAAKPKPKPATPSATSKPKPVVGGGGVKALASVLAGAPGLAGGGKAALKPPGAKPKPSAAPKPASKPKPAVKPKAPAANEYVVIAPHKAETPEEADLRVGDIVVVEEQAEGGWWFVVGNGFEGWAPADMLQPNGGLTVDVSCRGAFKGRVPRKACEQALKTKGKHCDYIVRESETVPGDYSFTVKIHSKVHHFKVVNKGTKFMVGDATFGPDLEEVTDYFLREPIYTDGGDRIKLGNAYTASVK